jgi:uroporphyrinogen decarboxylase
VIAQAVRDAGADGVVLGEDLAYNRSTFFSPGQLRELYFPALADLVRQIHELGLSAFFHSDGNLNSILPDLAACELDGLQGLEPEAGMTVPGVRERIGNTLTLWGNLSFDFLSAERTEQEIEKAVKSIADGGGKLILGSCGGLVEGLNSETVRKVHRIAYKSA